MSEFFITARSFAAPFVSDTSEGYVEAEDAQEALTLFVRDYSHPCGLFAAECFQSADDFHKGRQPLKKYRSYAALSKGRDEKEGMIL